MTKLLDPKNDGRVNNGNKSPFVAGNKLGRGRPKGSRHKISEAFLSALHSDFEAHGQVALEKCREGDPSTYIRVVASLLPKDVTLTINPIEELTDDELVATMESLGQAIAAEFKALLRADGLSQAGGETTLEHEEIAALPPVH